MRLLILPMLFFAVMANAQIVINELMASNDSLSGIFDEYNEYDDWVELYNNGSSSVDIGNYYISDADTTLDKWQIPAGTMVPASGYLIIWTDKDENNGQVPLHTNFRLSADGEMVVLSDASLNIVDQVTFGPQEKNKTLARIPNGTGDFVTRNPTFNTFNGSTNTTNLPPNFMKVFPNPGADIIQIRLNETVEHPVPYEIIDSQGKVLITGLMLSQDEISLKQLASGSYFLRYRIDNAVGVVPLQKK